MEYGYVRVSSKMQNEDRQIIALINYGVKKENIFADKQSGKDFDRENYKRLINKMKERDVLVIEDIDRLGRNYTEILDQWRIITKEKKCDVVVINMSLLDTRLHKDLTGTFIADLTLQILSYVAENERLTTKRRQAEGIAAAKLRGVRFGRPPREKPDNYNLIEGAWKRGLISARRAAEKLGVNRGTFLKWVRETK